MYFKNGTYHKPGVYFGMPEDEYHADASLGSTDLRRLVTSPLEYYWHSSINPYRKPENDSTPAKLYGKAIHKCVLEGREAFDRLYAKKPDKPKPGSLVTLEDLRAKAAEIGISKSGTKATLIERILELHPETPIHDVEVARYMAEHADKILLKEDEYAEIIMAADNIAANPHLKTAFTGGVSEVSVFWEQQGIPCKCRFDYLKPRAIVDLKSTRNMLQQQWDVAVANFLARGRYEIQAAHYMHGRMVLPQLVEAGAVHGDHDKKLLKRVMAETNFQFVFVVYQADGAPLTYGVIFSPEEADYAIACDMIDLAFEAYRQGFEKFGEREWIELGKMDYWGNMSFPMWRGT